MRGTLACCYRTFHRRGIIPAHAGNTPMICFTPIRMRDHPRACGEHALTLRSFSGGWGSSPRMRGTHSRCDDSERRRGIIPAHAGNTRLYRIYLVQHRDHPRACGEHRSGALRLVKRMGSSPRMRGTLGGCASDDRLRGIIPAHAGNTSKGRESPAAPGDHPRACGEHMRGSCP